MIESYVGRPWSAGTTDAYGLVRDFYKDQFNIELVNIARPEYWWTANDSLFLDALQDDGFKITDVPVYKVRIGDLLLVSILSSVPNHVGIYVGGEKVLHHQTGRLSTVEPLKGVFRDKLCAVLRHPAAVVETTVKTVELVDLMSPTNRAKFEKDSK